MTSIHTGGAASAGPRWTTTCFGHSTDTTPLDLTALGDHVSRCRTAGSHFGGLHCLVQALHGMAASRFVTTLTLMAALIGAVLLVQ